MAQTTKKTKKAPTKKSSKKAAPVSPAKKADSEKVMQRRSLWSQVVPYLLIVGAIFLVVCFISGAGEDPGVVIGFIYQVLTGLFGGSAFVIPAFLAFAAIAGLFDKTDALLGMRTAFALCSIVLTSMLLEIISPLGSFQIVELYKRGGNILGGGVIGGVLGEFFLWCFKTAGSYVLIIAMLILCVLLTAGITPKYLVVYLTQKARESKARRQELREAGVYREPFRDPDEIPRRAQNVPQSPAKAQAALAPRPAVAVPGNRRKKKFDTDVPVDDYPESEESAAPAPVEFEADPEEELFAEVLERSRSEKTAEELQAEQALFQEESHLTESSPTDDVPFLTEEIPAVEISEAQPEPAAPEGTDLIDQLADAYLGKGKGDGETTPAEKEEPEALAVNRDSVAQAAPAKQIPIPTPEPTYNFPPIDLLSAEDNQKQNNNIRDELHDNAARLVSVLASFNVKTKIVGVSRGPTITRYELLPEAGTRVRSIANLVDDIALNLATTGVRIEAPIPGKAAVGIEVPNKTAETVYLRSLLETEDFQKNPSKIATSLGKDVAGSAVIMDIKKMPHLLIAGATGMGKSVCINCLLVSLLYKAKPSEVKLILIDPKKVEFGIYNGLPHLLVPVVSDPKKAAGSLNWAVNEMERRFGLIEAVGVRDIAAFNEITKNDPEYEYMPQIVIVIDELADLMSTAPDDVETSIARLAAKARAAGMHLVIGTQRPSVDVITGVIKANIPSRIAFTVAAQIDSRTIIDRSGAENLIGRGDMLYNPVGAAKPQRVQGAFVSEKEVDAVVTYIKTHNTADGTAYSEDVMKEIEAQAAMCGSKKGGGGAAAGADSGENDPLLKSALDVAFESGKISTSLLQRRLSVGYGRAAKIIDRMEQLGYVSAPDGQKPRELLISKQDYMEMVLKEEDGTKEG